MAALRAVAYSRAAARSSSAGTPVISSTASGLFSARAMNSAHSSKPSQRSADERLVDQPLGDHDVRHRVDDRHVGARLQLQVVLGLDVRRAHQVDAARVDDDQLRALAQPLLHPRREHRVAVGRVGADDQDDVGLLTDLKSCVPADVPKVCLSP